MWSFLVPCSAPSRGNLYPLYTPYSPTPVCLPHLLRLAGLCPPTLTNPWSWGMGEEWIYWDKGHSFLSIDTAPFTLSYTGSHTVSGAHVGDVIDEGKEFCLFCSLQCSSA